MIEDQRWPKRCGHMAGKQVVPTADMVNKVRAMVAERRIADTFIFARTDARAVNGSTMRCGGRSAICGRAPTACSSKRRKASMNWRA